MKYLLLILFFLATACGLHYSMALMRLPATQDEAAVSISTKCAAGSGVIVGRHTILTALHVINDCDSRDITITKSNGKTYSVTAEAALAIDIARLHVEEDLLISSVTIDKAKVGEKLCSAPVVPSRGRSCGEVTSVGDGDSEIIFTGKVEPGNSGSGMYNSRGHLVGIVTRRFLDSDGGTGSQIPKWFADD